MVVWDSTGSICKVNGYLSRTGFSSLDDYGRFSAVVWLKSFPDLANLFWLKVLLVPVGVWSLGWLFGAHRLWGRFEILYGYVNGALRFELCRLWWDFYFALLYPNGCLGSVIFLLFKPAWFMLLVLWTLYSVDAFAFRAVSTKSCGVLFVWAETCNFGILKSGQTGRTFSLFFRIGYNGLPEYYCTRYELELITVCAVSCGCWGFRTCFVEGKAECFK